MISFIKIHTASILFTIILLIGFYIRIIPVMQNTFAYTYDVGRDMIALQKIVYELDVPLIGPTTGLHGLFYGPWWYYMLAPSFLISAGNPQGIVAFMGLSGLLTIVIGYIFGKKISGPLLGIIFALFISFSPLMISLTSQIWNPNIAPLWIILIIYILFDLEKNINSKKYFYKISDRSIKCFLLGLLLALSIDAEVVYGLLLSVGCGIYFFTRTIRKSKLHEVILIIGGFVFIFTPKILFELRNNFLMTRTLLNFASGNSDKTFSMNVATVFESRFNFFLEFISNTFGLESKFLAICLVLACGFILIVYRKLINSNEMILLRISAVIVIIFFIGLTFFDQNVWTHYIVGLPIIFILVVGIAIKLLFSRLQKKSHLLTASFLVFASIYLINPVNIFNELTKANPSNDVALYRNHLDIIDYIYEEANGEEFKYITYTPPVHDYTYTYLFNWYGKNKYGYVPSEKSNRLFFLILEPDLEDKTRLDKWLTIRADDGLIVKERTFPSGVRVQIRKIN